MVIARSDTRLSGTSGERTWSWKELGTCGNDLSSFPGSFCCCGLPSARGGFLCWSSCCPSPPGAVPVLPWPLQLCCTSLQLDECGFHTWGGSSCSLQVLSWSKRAGTTLPFAFPSVPRGMFEILKSSSAPFSGWQTHIKLDQNLTLFLLQDLDTLSMFWDALLFGFPWRNKGGFQPQDRNIPWKMCQLQIST